MKRLLFFILHSSFFISCAMAQPMMRDVFAVMPDSVLPLVTKNNRLDCIDFIENNMEARVRNRMGEYVALEALTSTYARFRTSPLTVMEMKLLPLTVPEGSPESAPEGTSEESPEGPYLLCLVATTQTGEPNTSRRLEDSNIRFLTPDWRPLPVAAPYQRPAAGGFLHMQLSPDASTLTLTPQRALQTLEEREKQPAPTPLVLHWNGSTFAE